jgi:hypothetical protein
MGEFDIDRIVELLDSGELLWTDLCWAQGMAGWGPLTGLRAEVAAAKAFPPVAALPALVASGRRRVPVAPGLVSPSQAAGPKSSGWAWVAGGVTLGAAVGLLTTFLFPQVVHVDRPVEKIVEKVVERPVEVVRFMEKRVSVPAELSAEQRAAEIFYKRFYDRTSHKEGGRLFNLSDKVKVYIGISGAGSRFFSEGLVKAKVESAFRAQGFKVLTEESREYPFSVVHVGGVFLDMGVDFNSIITGSYNVKICQPVYFVNSYDFSGPANVIIKNDELVLYERSGALFLGSLRYNEVIDAFEQFAQEAANELRKARDN